jgi:hypothetical protein
MQVSIMCFNPDLFDPTPVHLTGNTTSGSTTTSITYDGHIETGVIFTLNVDRTLTDFTLYHTLPSGEIRSMDFSGALASGDVLTISTVLGSKGVTLVRSGISSSMLWAVSPQSSWMALVRGVNQFRVYAEGAAVPYTLDYTKKYGAL